MVDNNVKSVITTFTEIDILLLKWIWSEQ